MFPDLSPYDVVGLSLNVFTRFLGSLKQGLGESIAKACIEEQWELSFLGRR